MHLEPIIVHRIPSEASEKEKKGDNNSSNRTKFIMMIT